MRYNEIGANPVQAGTMPMIKSGLAPAAMVRNQISRIDQVKGRLSTVQSFLERYAASKNRTLLDRAQSGLLRALELLQNIDFNFS